MRLSKIVTGLLVACVLAIGWLALTRITIARDAKKDTGQARELEQLRADVASLQASVQSSQRLAISAAQVASMARSVPAEPAEEARPPGESAAAGSSTRTANLTSGEQQSLLQSRFDLESPDPAWSRDAALHVRDQLRGNLTSNSRIVSVECRRSLCRVESRHDDLDAYRRFAHEGLAIHDGSWNGTVMSSLLGSGSEREPTAVSYLIRPGEDFDRLVAEEVSDSP